METPVNPSAVVEPTIDRTNISGQQPVEPSQAAGGGQADAEANAAVIKEPADGTDVANRAGNQVPANQAPVNQAPVEAHDVGGAGHTTGEEQTGTGAKEAAKPKASRSTNKRKARPRGKQLTDADIKESLGALP